MNEKEEEDLSRMDTRGDAPDSRTAPTSEISRATPTEVEAAVEAHIVERIQAGKQPSKGEIEWMRSWPALMVHGEPHPWYGPCDGLGADGGCGECERTWHLPNGEASLDQLRRILEPQGWRFEPTPDGMQERVIRPDGTLAGVMQRTFHVEPNTGASHDA